jgi:mannose-6-phosphate isomerase class I
LALSPSLVKFGNFTPPERTPWGGHRILTKYKAGLRSSVDSAAKVGESWEVSTEPTFPSILESGEPLADVITSDAIGWLGPDSAAMYQGQNALLVKLVDAASTLSVQVHPPEQHALLRPGESGKTEAWIILDADADSAIYLGFQESVTRQVVEQFLRSGQSLEPLLNRVSVKPGDVFFISPGTVHALGAGVTLLEPQRVWPGRRAVTYRFWDWNRRFDTNGNIDPHGEPRPLHVTEALEVTNWDLVGASHTMQHCVRVPSVTLTIDDSSWVRTLIDERELFVQECVGTVSLDLDGQRGMLAVLCLSGGVELTSGSDTLFVHPGRTAVVASAAATRLSLHAGRAVVCASPA